MSLTPEAEPHEPSVLWRNDQGKSLSDLRQELRLAPYRGRTLLGKVTEQYRAIKDRSVGRTAESAKVLTARQRIAVAVLGSIRWLNPTQGLGECPKGEPDALMVYVDKLPTCTCFHARCADELTDWNEGLREACRSAGYLPELAPTDDDKAEQAADHALSVLAARTREWTLPRILAGPPCALADLSPAGVRLPGDTEQHAAWLIAGLYDLDDHEHKLWCGELHEARLPECFRTAEHWLRTAYHPGPQLSPALFFDKPSRTDDNVYQRRYFVAESDILAKADFRKVIRWLQRDYCLRAVVDTAGKSLHAWFDLPGLALRPPPAVPPEVATPDGRVNFDYGEGLSNQSPRRWRLTQVLHRHWAHERHVDTYNCRARLLHASRIEQIYAVVRGLGADRQMLHPAGTTRLPGHHRKAKDEAGHETGPVVGTQRLLYLNPLYPNNL